MKIAEVSYKRIIALAQLAITRRALLSVLVLVATALYYVLSVLRHRHFESGWDLAIFDQAVWHLSRFDFPVTTVRFNQPENILGDHFHPILALLAPLYWFIDGAEALLLGQAFLVALSIVPIFLFTARRLGQSSAWLFTLSYSIFWGMQRTVEFEFHEIAFAVPLIAFAIYFIDLRKPKGYFACFFLLLLTKESMPVLIAFFGVYLLLLKRYRDALLSIGLGALTFPLITKIIIPFFSGRSHTYWTYEALGPDLSSALKTMVRKPLSVLELLTSPATKLRTTWLIFSPFLFLPLISPLMVLFIPIFAERFLSSRAVFWEPLFHYNATITPIVALAAADVLGRISKLLKRERTRKISVGLLSAAILAVNLYMLPGLPLWRLTSPGFWRLTPRDEDGYAAISIIPPGASVATQTNIAPHLTHRRGVYIIHPDRPTPPTTYIITSSQITHYPFDSYRKIEDYLTEQLQKGYIKVFDRNGWIVLKRPGVNPELPPIFLTREDSKRAAALDSVTLTEGPFPVNARHPISKDGRTRISLFALNVISEYGGSDYPDIEVIAEDELGRAYPMEVEAVLPLDTPIGLTQLSVKLPDELKGLDHIWVSIKSGSLKSDKALIDLQPP